MSTTLASASSTPPYRRLDDSLIGRLNTEWDQLRASRRTMTSVRGWAAGDKVFAGCVALTDIEATVAAGGRGTADWVLSLSSGSGRLVMSWPCGRSSS